MKPSLGSKLLGIRTDRKLSQAEMADILGMTPSTYSRVERGESSPNYIDLISIAEKLKIPIQDLLPETFSISNVTNKHQGGNVVGYIINNTYYYSTSDTIKELENRLNHLEAENAELKKKFHPQ